MILDEYIEGLYTLSRVYDDREYRDFVNDLKQSDLYIQAFSKSIILAETRNVPEERILKTKEDIDSYFGGGKN